MKANVLLQNIKLLDSEGVCYPEYDDASFPSKRNIVTMVLICITEGNNHILIFVTYKM